MKAKYEVRFKNNAAMVMEFEVPNTNPLEPSELELFIRKHQERIALIRLIEVPN